MATYAEMIERLGQAVTDNTPKNHKIDLTVYNKMREVIDYYLWLKESPDHDDIQIAVKKSATETSGYLHVTGEHINVWTEYLHTRFCEEMKKPNVYEIYAVRNDICIDMSFHNLYVPI